jgi:hypothetical protein
MVPPSCITRHFGRAFAKAATPAGVALAPRRSMSRAAGSSPPTRARLPEPQLRLREAAAHAPDPELIPFELLDDALAYCGNTLIVGRN